ncbi:MAG: hypothetical protein QM760_00875 [Nibricoccus sp.]
MFHDLLRLLGIGGGFFLGAFVGNGVLGGLDDDVADVVVALAAGAAGDLAEIADGENAGFLAVVFEKLGEDDGADGDVDADTEGVGAADELEKPFLRELLDEDAVAREQAGVVDADAVAEPALHFLSVGAVEADAFEGLGDPGFFFA